MSHCFHDDGICLTSYPEQYPQTCCHCGATRIRTWRAFNSGKHGRYAFGLKETVEVFHGGEGECEPKSPESGAPAGP